MALLKFSKSLSSGTSNNAEGIGLTAETLSYF